MIWEDESKLVLIVVQSKQQLKSQQICREATMSAVAFASDRGSQEINGNTENPNTDTRFDF